jgi:hypothetical protein
MSTHKPGLDVSELLGDDGTVDHSVIKSLTNADAGGGTRITTETCDKFRRAIQSGATAKDTAAKYEVGATAVRRHVRGECHHMESQLTEPPLSHTQGVGWEVDE